MRNRNETSEGPPAAARSAGLRRLSRLTWRATQLSAVTAVGFATLFARTAPVQTADQATTTPSTEPSVSVSSAGTPTPSASQRHHRVGRKAAPGAQPTAQAGPAASPSGSGSSSPGPSSSSSSSSSSGSGGGSGSHSSSPSPTLAPPSSAPAPAPSTSSAPAPKPTVTSSSHAGG
jgi:peptidoglycan DL-endopeptidase CwlO